MTQPPQYNKPAVGLVLAATPEYVALRPAVELLKSFDIQVEVYLSSVWAAPERLLGWAERAESRGIGVLIAAAGAEPQLPGFLAAACRLPVIAVPLGSPSRDAARQMELALQTSPAAPVAVVAPGGAQQAALLALRMLALASAGLRKEIEIYRQTLVNELDGRQAKLAEAAETESAAPPPRLKTARPQAPQPETPWPDPPRAPDDTAVSRYTEPGEEDRPAAEMDEEEARVGPANLDRPLAGKPAPPRPPAAPAANPARMLGRMRVDHDAPDVEVIEEAIDCLLEGGVIAFPTETVYGLAADATNPAAVERLYELKGRPRGKSVTLMVDSPKLLGNIACNLTVEARRLMEAFWPGPLTIIFQKRGANFSHVSPEETIGVRLPDHSVPLAIVQALARPLACTSANLAGQPECFNAGEVERAFGGRLNLILDGGELDDNPPSTVIDVTREPYRILRQGAVTREQIAAVVGDKLDQE